MKLLKKSLFFSLFFISVFSSIYGKKQDLIIIGAGGKKGMEYFNIIKSDVNVVGFVQPRVREDLLLLSSQNNVPIYPNLSSIPDNVHYDGALIVVPHYLHFDYTQKLLKQGKFVIKEKPLAMNYGEVAEYKKVIDQFDGKLFTIVQRQVKESFMMAKNDLFLIGRIYSFKYEYNLNLPCDTTGWRAKKDQCGGGALLDMGYHAVDMITTFFGMPSYVAARSTYKTELMSRENIDEEFFGLLSYSSGIIGSIILSRYGRTKMEKFEISGEKGTIVINPNSYSIYDIQGNLIKKHESNQSKKDAFSDLFKLYLGYLNDEAYCSDIFKHHQDNMKLIGDLYACT